MTAGAALPVAAADHTPPGQIVCKDHTPNCGKKVRTISKDVHVNEDEDRQFKDGTFYFEGSIFVHAGGTLRVSNAVMIFGPESLGIRVEALGFMEMVDSVLQPDPNFTETRYALDIQAGSAFSFTGTRVIHGLGVTIASSDGTFDANRLEGMDTALALVGTSLTVSNSEFALNDLHVYQEGGTPTLSGNSFAGGTTCVHNFRTNPTIVGNAFVGCHTGIHHEESHSSIVGNTFIDDGVPPGAGIKIGGAAGFADVAGFAALAADPEPVLIEGNVIENYATGIEVRNGRAIIRDNVVANNPGAGIYVESNVASMEIVGNTVESNAGHGIHLVGVSAVTVKDNLVAANAGDGILLAGVADVTLESNTVTDAGAAGISVDAASTGVALTANTVKAAALAGVHVLGAGTALSGNVVDGSGDGFVVTASGVTLSGDVARGNAGTGFLLTGADGLVASDLLATGNGLGVGLEGSAPASLTRVNASENVGHGFRFAYAGDVTALAIARPTAIGNGGDGVLNAGAPIAMEAGWFESNAGFGVRTATVESAVSAPLAWWGDALGPGNIVPLSSGDEASENVVWFPPALAPPAD